MKVYARYFGENGLGFRRDTILQFGNSWDLIGSIVLINPGSAVPKNTSIQAETLAKLLSITQTNDPDSWKEFSIDPTMRQIAKLFSGQLIGQERPLNGIIQLFNLFNLRNANLYGALELFKTTSNTNIVSIENDITRIGKKPIYFGWGNTGKYQLKDMAKKVFETLPQQPYLNNNFEDNSFYHPRYLQMSSKKNGNVIKLLHDFYNQDKSYKWDGIVVETMYIDANLVHEKFNQLFLPKKDIFIKSDKSTTRIFFQDIENNELEFIVTKKEDGYVAIRYKKIVKENTIDYMAIGVSFGFELIPNYKNDGKGEWFSRQSFEDFEVKEEDKLANQLIEVCKEFLSMRKI